MSNEPKIKLRDGWTWEWMAGFGAWNAVDPGDPGKRAIFDCGDGTMLLSTWTHADVVLAVIAANAPEVLREFLAGLATRNIANPSHGALWDAINRYAAATGGQLGRISSARMDAVVDVEHCAVAYAADCYPEMAAKIAELERECQAPGEPPVEWVDGRATVGGFTLEATPPMQPRDVRDFRDACWSVHVSKAERPTRPIVLVIAGPEDTAKRGAIAVARAMGGGT